MNAVRACLVGFCCALMLAASAQDSRAQSIWSVVAGPTFGTISSDQFSDASYTTGFFAGVGRATELSDRWSVTPYVAYVQKGADFNGEIASYDYIEIPVFFTAAFPLDGGKAFTASVGPQFGFQINCDEDGTDCSDFADASSIEAGVVGGLGLAIPHGDDGSFSFGVAADWGITDLFDTLDFKTRTYYLFARYAKTIGG